MSRGLPTVVYVLCLAFSAVAASAGPGELFDARAKDALRPGQRELLLALDGGRYVFENGRLADTRASEPDRLLTNARVEALLAGPRDGAALDASAASGADPAYERALARMPKGAPVPQGFDGAAAHAGDVRGPPASGPRGGQTAPASADPAVLQARLLQRVAFKGTKPERQAFGEAVALIMKTKTGSELARQFVHESAAAEVVIAATSNAGSTDTGGIPPKVTLDRKYVTGSNDPNYSRIVMAGTLAHELFGHALETQRARTAGFSKLASYHYRGDEVGSRLIDWSVQTELAGKVADADPQDFLGDPEAYYRGMATRDPYYVVSLSAAEMKDPIAALAARRALLAADEAKTAAEVKQTEAWLPVIAHFVSAHGVAKGRFEPAEKEIGDYLSWGEGHRKKLVESKANLESHIARWSSRAGAAQRKELADAADSAFLRNWDAQLRQRARDLTALRAGPGGRGPAAIEVPVVVITAPKPGGPPIDLEELSRMYQRDKKTNARHFK